MGIGKLNVYITALGQPSKVDNASWYVSVATCDGSILNWSEGRFKDRPDGPWIPIPAHVPPNAPGTHPLPQGWWYDNVPANNGHVEIEVPPGRYVVAASKHAWTGVVYDYGIAKYVLYGNYATDRAILNVNSGEDASATLYSATLKYCWDVLFEFIIMTLIPRSAQAMQALKLADSDIKTVQEAAKVLNEKLFKPLTAQGITPFEQMHLEQLKRAVQRVATE